MARRLTHAVQTFIVESLARFMTPTEVSAAVKEEFNIDVKRELVRHYNPDQSVDSAAKWRAVFDEARKKFLANVDQIGIAQQPYRLAELQRLYHAAGRNVGLKKDLLEQAAKEVGGVFTNRRELTGKGGTPIQIEKTNRQEWAETQLAQFMQEFKLDRDSAIKKMKQVAPTVVQYLGNVG